MKFKIIESDFNKETGISKVTIQTKLGHFTGIAKCCEEDMKNISSFAGCRYAELRAIIKHFEKDLEITKYKISSLEECKRLIESLNNYNKHSIENRKIRKMIYILNKHKTDLNEQICSLNKRITNLINERDNTLNSLDKKKGE